MRLWKQEARLEIGQPRRHDEIVRGKLQPEPPRFLDEGEILIRQSQDRYFREIDLLLAGVSRRSRGPSNPSTSTTSAGSPPVLWSTNSASNVTSSPITTPSRQRPRYDRQSPPQTSAAARANRIRSASGGWRVPPSPGAEHRQRAPEPRWRLSAFPQAARCSEEGCRSRLQTQPAPAPRWSLTAPPLRYRRSSTSP